MFVDQVWAVVAGYLLAPGLGGFTGSYAVRYVLREGLRRKAADGEVDRSSRPGLEVISLGIIERVLYTSAVWGDELLFIGIWLALKGLVTRWERWDEDRRLFNIFLVGTGVSLAFGVLGGVIT